MNWQLVAHANKMRNIFCSLTAGIAKEFLK